MENQDKRIELYTSVVPNARQLGIQEMKFYAFIHYTVNTFTNKEWGDGKENPAVFNPTGQNTDQWCEAIKSAGMKGVILTCKHHDGFCLWQTKTTEHSVKNSPYKGGKGDVAKELSESCRKYGLKFGVYLSPWDRNSEYYSTDKYMDFYIAQLTELLTGYGEIFMLWLDGACEPKRDGKSIQEYDFERIWSTALNLQPKIAISGCAPDIRWVGNESGVSRESEWNVVPKFRYEFQNFAVNCQKYDYFENFKNRCKDVYHKDMGSREFLADYNEFIWYPAEVDVSIRRGWFYHSIENFSVKSLKHLMKIYYSAVGGNSLLLLNIPPNKQGLFCKNDVARLKEMGDWLKVEDDCVINKIVIKQTNPFEISLDFEKQAVDRVRLSEDTTKSQRIEKFSVYAEDICVYTGTVIGFSKIAIFDEPVTTANLKIVIDACRKEPFINKIEVCKTGAYRF